MKSGILLIFAGLYSIYLLFILSLYMGADYIGFTINEKYEAIMLPSVWVPTALFGLYGGFWLIKTGIDNYLERKEEENV